MKTNLRRWIEGGFVGTTAGFVGSAIFIASRALDHPSDVLGFLGAFAGSGLAIIGARWLEQRRRADEQAESLQLVYRAAEGLSLSALTYGVGDPQGLAGRLHTVRQRATVLVAVAKAYRGSNIYVLQRIEAAVYWLPTSVQAIENAINAINAGSLTPPEAIASLEPAMQNLVSTAKFLKGVEELLGNDMDD